MYRGETDVDDKWDIKKIRKDREPRDTDPLIHVIVDAINEAQGLRVPKRKEAKFAGGAEEMSKYGSPFVCFPEKDAPIYHLEEDSFNTLKSAHKQLTHITFLGEDDVEKIKGEFPYFSDFFLYINKVKVDFEVVYNFISQSYGDIFQEAKQLSKSLQSGPDIKSAATHMKNMFRIIEDDYYGEIEKGS